MINSTMYLVGKRRNSNIYEEGAMSCQTCRKLIINSGIKYVIVRISKTEYIKVDVQEWIENDDLLERYNNILSK